MSGPERATERSAAPRARDAEIREALRPHAENGWVDCRDALAIAARLGVPPVAIGRICDLDGIKIANCQLGCFGMRAKRGA